MGNCLFLHGYEMFWTGSYSFELVAGGFGWYGWFQVVLDGFGWFAVLVVTDVILLFKTFQVHFEICNVLNIILTSEDNHNKHFLRYLQQNLRKQKFTRTASKSSRV